VADGLAETEVLEEIAGAGLGHGRKLSQHNCTIRRSNL
jgi:hypothetical protein